MADEDTRAAPPEPSSAASLAAAMGATGDPKVAAEARAFFAEQTRLAREQIELVRLQAEDLRREDQLRHWSLRIRHTSDVLKLGFELAAAALVTMLVVFVLGAVWNAAHDDGLVIEAFNVPADMAANGLSGQIVATQIQDRLAWMQANTDTIRQGDSYRSAFGDDIKVQIPDTGISIGEFYRTLAAWLGHQKHISGEIWRGSQGLSLGVRSSAASAAVFTGKDDALPSLVAKAAERIYWQTQPYRYVVFLDQSGRHADSVKFSHILAEDGAPEERPWAYARLALSASDDGDFAGAIRFGRIAAALNPDLPHVWGNLAGAEAGFGHDEDILRDNRRSVALLENPATAHQLAAYAVEVDILESRALVSEMVGDYRDAMAQDTVLGTKPVYSGSDVSAPMMLSVDRSLDHDFSAPPVSQNLLIASLVSMAAGQYATDYPTLPEYERAAARGDWRTARDSVAALLRLPIVSTRALHWIVGVYLWPKLALSDAMLGDFRTAQSLIDRTPRDCYLCVIVRGRIAARQRDWRDAEAWFADAVRRGPSLPFAQLEWGAMLMAKGDLDGAIAKFSAAHAKGPHFADPLELWGEALIAKNRSDLALAKFSEAATYAPNWGRLHLKWGEALWWSGDKDGARKQFAAAAGLFLAPGDRAVVARLSAR